MTDQTIITQNKLRAILAYTFRVVALLCANGSFMQTFLSITGFSEQHIYMHASLFQAVNVLTIILCARFADRGNVLHRTALVQIPGGLLFLLYVPLCILQKVSLGAYVWLLLVSLLQSVSFALHTICEYKAPYYIYKPEEYGMVLSICGILSSVVTFGAGAMIGFFSIRYSYTRIMPVAFGISCVFLLFSGILQYFQKSLPHVAYESAKQDTSGKIPLSIMFRHEAFSRLFVGNLTRGIANGTTTILAAAALSVGYDETLTSAMVSVQSLATLAACVLFAVLSKRIPPRYVIFLGSCCFLTLPVLMCQNRPVLYLSMYAILLFGRTLVDYAVPASLLYAVPVELAGTYNAWRMILHNVGTLFATVIAGYIPLSVMLWISLACQMISGINFFTAKVMRVSCGSVRLW